MNGTTRELMFSSDKQDWETPREIFEALHREFQFTLDPCATQSTAKCSKYYTAEDSGLDKDWAGEVVFMNPPYGRSIGDWIKKAYREGGKPNTTVVALIPARTDTRYFHSYCMNALELRFIKGRLKFLQKGAEQSSAPFPSMVVVFSRFPDSVGHNPPMVSAVGIPPKTLPDRQFNQALNHYLGAV